MLLATRKRATKKPLEAVVSLRARAPTPRHLPLEEDAEKITLTVESYGPKIAADEFTRIFDLFYRGEAARKRDSEGTGFGLASAQNVARAYETEITVEQREDRAREDTFLTTFSVTFDVVAPQ